jgi:hypothetical protein
MPNKPLQATRESARLKGAVSQLEEEQRLAGC